MKHLLKNATNRLFIFLVILAISAILSILFCPSVLPTKKAQAAASPAFVKKYQTITLNQKVQYKIKNMKKTNYAYFSVSNSALASIEKKTGWLTPKKAGKLTIKAIIYNNKHKKLKTLTKTITIQNEKKILPNATFEIKETINPWDFTLSLSCSRILLKKEINTDKLTIFPKGKSNPKLTASFTSLSDDGKEVIYTLTPSSQSILCPGDYSMDGYYTLESQRFSKKLSLRYNERLTNNTLSGFVLKTDGNSVKNALVTLKKGNSAIKSCYTDQSGHYKLQNISDATSLTAEKSGFQKTTIINPTISSRGTTCENMILRSTEETETAIESIVTDTQNLPIPNATVYLLADDGITPNDSFPTQNILYAGKTDSSGRLLLTNSASLPAAPCSILTVGNQSQLTYSSRSDFSSKKVVLSSSILNNNQNYTMYITCFSPEQPTIGYNAKKLSFSLSDFMTNYISLHIQLEKCQNTCIKDLSIMCDNSPPLCRSLKMQFYQPNTKEPFYQHTINKDNFIIDGSQMNVSSLLLPISLPDGSYYLSIQVLSEENNTLLESPVISFQVTNGMASLETISLARPRYARILAYGDFDKNPFSKASFALYQKCDEHYFLIGTFDTDPFVKNDISFFTSNLYLSNLIPNQNYLLSPLSGSVTGKEYLTLSTTKENTYPTKENTEYSPSPIAQIRCTDSKSDFTLTPDDFNHNTMTISYETYYNISQDFIRSQKTYPNCVLAFYQPNGNLLTTTLTTPPADTSDSKKNPDNSSDASIIDTYTNKEILTTNQNSYQY